MLEKAAMTIIGIIMQGFGTVFLTVPIWAPVIPAIKKNTVFSTDEGNFTDPKSSWVWLIRSGLVLQILGTILVLFGVK